MGDFSRWLLHEDQKEFFDYLYALVLNAVFLAVAALILWPLDHATLALQLAKGYWVFWTVLIMTGALLVAGRRLFRVDIDSDFDAYVISALVVSGIVQAGWSAYAALAVEALVAGTPGWIAAILYSIGFVSCFVAYAAICAFYMGSLYRLINLGLALSTFAVFSVWPAAARAVYGWFFRLVRQVTS